MLPSFRGLAGGTFALAWYMPTAEGQWHWPIGAALAGMLGLTVVGYRQSERLAVYGGTLELLFDNRSSETRHRKRPATRVAFDSRLSGLRRMVWVQFRNAAIASVIAMSVFVLMGSLPWSSTPSRLEQIRQAVSTMLAEIGAQIWVFGLVLNFVIGQRRWHPSGILLLRTLPIGSRETNWLLLLRPVLTWFAYWLVLVPMYSLSPAGTHPWMGLGSLAGWIGVTGLANAALLRWHRRPLAHMVPMVVLDGLLFGHPWTYINFDALSGGMGQWAALALGTGCLVAAFAWNQGSVDRVKHALRADDVAVKAVPTRQDALRQVEIVAEPGERDDRDLAGLEVRISLVNLVERRD
ncbi:MAG: hypothetical protein HQ485_05390 [Acidobacteria bacterium]|nr:hypothetical protein [Acidobacteriota bacterium]